jgi:transposase
MTKSYSLDLRQRVARFVEAGHSCHAAARHFQVSVAFVVRLMATYRATGRLAPKPEGGWRYSKLDPHREFLICRMAEKGDITTLQLAAELLTLGTKFDLFETELPTMTTLTPNLSALPTETQRKLISLMACLFANRWICFGLDNADEWVGVGEVRSAFRL